MIKRWMTVCAVVSAAMVLGACSGMSYGGGAARSGNSDRSSAVPSGAQHGIGTYGP